MSKPLRIGIVAGEASGDVLGAGLIRALKKRHPDALFEGIGGPLMLEEGFNTHVPMERLSVMGLVEVLGRLPELLGIRRRLTQYFIQNPPDVFIGIDAPDFNLGLERKLRQAGIKSVHYVSPTVWAWRENRMKGIAKSTDLMLTLFPFEAQFYERKNMPVKFVGHPLADKLPLSPDVKKARQQLGLMPSDKVITLMPGSRGGEVSRLGDVFLQAAALCLEKEPLLKFVLPAANDARLEQLDVLLQSYNQLPVMLIKGNAQAAMMAADVVLVASGTATLEAMLLKKPMVVAYKLAPLTYKIASRLVKQPFVALPNLLVGKELVPEILQDEVSPEALSQALMKQFEDQQHRESLTQTYLDIHQSLQRDADSQAADAVLTCLNKP